MKTKFITICLLFYASLLAAQQHQLQKALMEENSITFVETDNSVTYNIVDIQKMQYEGNTLFVYLKDNTIYSVDVATLSISNNGDKTLQNEMVESINSLNLSIFPNPARDILQVSYNLSDNSEIEINVFNLSGQKETILYSGSQLAGNNIHVLSITNLPTGTHLLQIKGSKFSITKTLIKQ